MPGRVVGQAPLPAPAHMGVDGRWVGQLQDAHQQGLGVLEFLQRVGEPPLRERSSRLARTARSKAASSCAAKRMFRRTGTRTWLRTLRGAEQPGAVQEVVQVVDVADALALRRTRSRGKGPGHLEQVGRAPRPGHA